MNKLQRVRQAASQAVVLAPKNVEAAALLQFYAGACYALDRAFALGYRDRTGKKTTGNPGRTARRVLKRVATGMVSPARRWEAGFYFNASLQRMASLNDRIEAVFPNSGHDLVWEVRREVNVLKHRVPSLLSKGRSITARQAVSSLEALGQWLCQCL